MFSPVFLQIDENPNGAALEGQVFQPKSDALTVARVRVSRGSEPFWSSITGVNADGEPCPALAYLVDDSGDGSCYLVTGGAWGLRLQSADAKESWEFSNKNQWSEPYLLMGSDGADIEFVR